MNKPGLNAVSAIAVLLVLTSCASTKIQPTSSLLSPPIKSLRFLDEYDIPYNMRFNNTTIGGLSGIDYDTKNNRYYLVSDDRSAIAPARFYTAQIDISSKGIDSVYFTAVTNLQQPNGKVYPNNKQDPFHTPDPEAMRYYAAKNQLVWSSEGERIIRAKDTVLLNPFINIISINGQYLDSFPLPPNLQMQSIEKGPRQNSVLEGMTFTNDYKTLYLSIEEPLYEDGLKADTTDNNAFVRIFEYDMATRKHSKQYAYKLEPVAYSTKPPGAFKINGVSDILYLGNKQLLVIERSFSTGRLASTIRVYVADLNGTSNIKDIPSLKNGKNIIPLSKRMLLNMDELGIFIDNIEGVTFGPLLPDGHRTLLFVADNNFNVLEKSQLLLFEVLK